MQATTRALAVAAAVFGVAVLAVAWAQGVDPLPGACAIGQWEPRRALPWLAVAGAPTLAYALAFAAGAKRAREPVKVGDAPYRQSVVEPPPIPGSPRWHVIARGLFAVVALAFGAAQSRQWSCPKLPETCRPTTKRIVFVGVAAHDPKLVEHLASHFRDCYGLDASVGAPVELPRHAWDEGRSQWIAEEVLEAIRADPTALTIGVTSDDMYLRGESWRYGLGTRDSPRRVAIVSSDRMRRGGQVSTEMVTKYAARVIALEYCGLPKTTDPTSVRAPTLMGPDDLDRTSELVW